MRLELLQIDAFSEDPFTANPAAVVLMDDELDGGTPPPGRMAGRQGGAHMVAPEISARGGRIECRLAEVMVEPSGAVRTNLRGTLSL